MSGRNEQPITAPREIAELREAYCLQEGLPLETALAGATEAAFTQHVRTYVMRRMVFRLTISGEWICLVNDDLDCRLQRANLPIPDGWRVVA